MRSFGGEVKVKEIIGLPWTAFTEKLTCNGRKKNKGVAQKSLKDLSGDTCKSRKGAMATKKKTSPKKTTKKAPQGKKKTPPPSSGRGSAVLVLMIMVLLTIIVLMAGDYMHMGKKITKSPGPNDEIIQPRRQKEKPVSDRRQERTTEKEKAFSKRAIAEKKTPVPEKKKEPEKNAPRKVQARVYFIRMDEKTEKIYLAPVRRKVSAEKKLEESLKALVSGPSPREKRKGYLNAVPSSLRIRSARIKNGIAHVDFNDAVDSGAGNILVSRLDQIIYTATQFKGVKAVQITVNGRRRATLGSDGLSISGPLHRRR